MRDDFLRFLATLRLSPITSIAVKRSVMMAIHVVTLSIVGSVRTIAFETVEQVGTLALMCVRDADKTCRTLAQDALQQLRQICDPTTLLT
jgi:hypothetical protein